MLCCVQLISSRLLVRPVTHLSTCACKDILYIRNLSPLSGFWFSNLATWLCLIYFQPFLSAIFVFQMGCVGIICLFPLRSSPSHMYLKLLWGRVLEVFQFYPSSKNLTAHLVQTCYLFQFFVSLNQKCYHQICLGNKRHSLKPVSQRGTLICISSSTVRSCSLIWTEEASVEFNRACRARWFLSYYLWIQT